MGTWFEQVTRIVVKWARPLACWTVNFGYLAFDALPQSSGQSVETLTPEPWDYSLKLRRLNATIHLQVAAEISSRFDVPVTPGVSTSDGAGSPGS